MAEGTIEADAGVFAKYAADAAVAAGMLLEGFEGMEASSTDALPGSGAFPDVWSDWDDFSQKAAELSAAAETVRRSGECRWLYGLGGLRRTPGSPSAGTATASTGSVRSPWQKSRGLL